MANKPIVMNKLRRVLQLYHQGKSKLFISKYLGLSRCIYRLKTIPLIDAYLLSFFTNEGRIKNDKNEYETEDYSTPLPGWLFRT